MRLCAKRAADVKLDSKREQFLEQAMVADWHAEQARVIAPQLAQQWQKIAANWRDLARMKGPDPWGRSFQ